MKKINIGWVSDSHCDYQQFGSPMRRRDFAFGLYTAVKSMIAAKVSAIIHTGDLFNSSRPSAEAVRALQELHRFLIDHKTFMYVNSGNHDWSETSWIEAVEPSGVGGLKCVDNAKVRVGDVVIFGYPSMSKNDLIGRLAGDNLKDVTVLMLHQMVKDFVGYPTATAIAMDEIPAIFPVIAIGDLHIHDLRTRTNEDGSTGLYGYPGSTELCSSTEDPVKRWVELKFEDGKLVNHQAHVFPTRPVVKYEIANAGDLEACVTAAQNLTIEVKAGKLVTPLVYVDFDTTIENVMTRMRQAMTGCDALIIPVPRHVPGVATARAATPAPEVELSIQDILQLQMPVSDAMFQITSQMWNPDVDPKMALSAFIEQRLKPVTTNSE